jgi:hypothetical protein
MLPGAVWQNSSNLNHLKRIAAAKSFSLPKKRQPQP